MKAVYLVGRIGTSLLVIGIALYLVYLIPSISFNSTAAESAGAVMPEKYMYSTTSSLSPTRGIHIDATGNLTFRIVLLGVSYPAFFNWTNDWARDHGGSPLGGLQGVSVYNGFDNYTALQAYIAQFPSRVLLDATGNSSQPVLRDYTPTTESNATFTIANPSSTFMEMNYTITYLGSVAPKGPTLLFAEIFMPVGLILAGPWLYGAITARRNRNLQLTR